MHARCDPVLFSALRQTSGAQRWPSTHHGPQGQGDAQKQKGPATAPRPAFSQGLTHSNLSRRARLLRPCLVQRTHAGLQRSAVAFRQAVALQGRLVGDRARLFAPVQRAPARRPRAHQPQDGPASNAPVLGLHNLTLAEGVWACRSWYVHNPKGPALYSPGRLAYRTWIPENAPMLGLHTCNCQQSGFLCCCD